MKPKAFFMVILAVLCIYSIAFAEEEITLTTYYPAPYGEYMELSAKTSFIVGEEGTTSDYLTSTTTLYGDVYILPQNQDEWSGLEGGNVGIGTASPSQGRLQVYRTDTIGGVGGTLANATLAISNAANDGFYIDENEIHQSGDNFNLYIDTAGKMFNFQDDAGSIVVFQDGGNVGIGTTSPEAKLHVGGTAGTDGIMFPDGTLQTTAGGIPSGVIVMWSGTLATIPTGWALCNGASGTPDLSNRFIYGVGPTEDPGATGGSDTHSHGMGTNEIRFGPLEGDTNIAGRLSFSGGQTLYGGYGGLARRWIDDTGIVSSGPGGVEYLQTQSGAVTDAAPTAPPYYKLAFIMKLP